MLRQARLERETEKDGFRIRGREVTRLESFSDAVFGFAVTLLVVSLEVPKGFGELMETMRGFLAFGICFTILAMIWNDHYHYSRRYGLEDGFVRFLTCFMLFIVLLYVYPLKFLFNLFINGMILRGARGQLTHAQGSTLFVIYGMGFAAIYLVLAALYLHAYRRRGELELNAIETLDTRWELYGMLCMASVGLVSVLVALTVNQVDLAGFVYLSLFVIMWVHGWLHGRKRRALIARQAI
ncbi:MAG: DUF1211 domain-containing protein [Verrucomicrobia bacterium]|nr:MAG: DUF1211 domain-containing protein [Verrucomicrobiota bacterium]